MPRLDRLRRNQRPHQYLREKPLSSYAEAIRGVLTALKLSNPQNPPKVILVTSSLPEEGKTTFAVSLASLVARSQKRVLLIDLDLRHPSVHRELGWQVSAGLVEYMAGERTSAGGHPQRPRDRAALPAGQGAHHDADRPARERSDARAAAGAAARITI